MCITTIIVKGIPYDSVGNCVKAFLFLCLTDSSSLVLKNPFHPVHFEKSK